MRILGFGGAYILGQLRLSQSYPLVDELGSIICTFIAGIGAVTIFLHFMDKSSWK